MATDHNAQRKNVLQRMARMTSWGILGGMILSCWAALLAIIRGAAFVPVDGASIHVGVLCALYLMGGACAGAVVGLLMPLARTSIGAAVVGVFAMLPISFGAVSTYTPLASWDGSDSETAVLTGILLGSVLGIMYRQIFGEEIKKQ